ncbi:hypothetical protein D3C86_903590 [compost metagenome]
MLGRVHGVGPGQVLVETDVDHRQARQRGTHHIQFAGDGQVHLIKTHAADPREMRIGQQHAAAVEGTITAHRHGIAAAVQGKTLLAHVRHLERCLLAGICGDSCRRRGTRQSLGKLADTTFYQQSAG